MKYQVMEVFYDEPVFETDNKKDAIKFIKDKEGKKYKKYLKYYQQCIDNYEDPTIDERPAPYYESYFICYNGGYYDITNLYLLERLEED